MKNLKLKVIIYKDEEFYTAQCIDVNVASFGRTILDAKKNIREALELYFDDEQVKTSRKSNREVPTLQLVYA